MYEEFLNAVAEVDVPELLPLDVCGFRMPFQLLYTMLHGALHKKQITNAFLIDDFIITRKTYVVNISRKI